MTKKIAKGRTVAAISRKPKRTASALLQVMLEPEDLERYKRMAEASGMTMRDFVRTALEALTGHVIPAQRYLTPEETAAAHAHMEERRDLLRRGHGESDEQLSVPEQLYGSTRGDSAALRGLLLHAERLSRLEDRLSVAESTLHMTTESVLELVKLSRR